MFVLFVNVPTLNKTFDLILFVRLKIRYIINNIHLQYNTTSTWGHDRIMYSFYDVLF